MVEARFPHVRLTKNKENVGFAKANNQILKTIERTRYFLLLNPDIIVTEGSLNGILSFMDMHQEVGIVGCKLLNPDNSLQYSCRRLPQPATILAGGLMFEHLFPNARIFRHYFMKDWDHKQAAEVDWVLGSCMMIRQKALLDAGYFDEKFFIYYEDVDLCLRMRHNQWKVYYLPQPYMIHHHIQESHKFTSLHTRVHHIRSAFYFFCKHDWFKSSLLRGDALKDNFKVLS